MWLCASDISLIACGVGGRAAGYSTSVELGAARTTAGTAAAVVPHPGKMDAAEGRSHARPTLTAAARLHRHRRRHCRVLRRVQGGHCT